MSFFKRLPVLPLVVLWLLYLALGWALASATSNWQVWALAACGIVLLALTFAAPSSLVRTALSSMLQSDARAFVAVVVGAFAVVMALTWLRYFARLMVLLAAGALARLELHAADYSEWPAFAILTTASLGGFGLGLLFYTRWELLLAIANHLTQSSLPIA